MKRDMYHEIVERWEKESNGDLRKLWEIMIQGGPLHSLMAKRLNETYKNNIVWNAVQIPATKGFTKIRIKHFYFPRKKGEFVIIMPVCMDQTRLIKFSNEAPKDINCSHIKYSGSRYGRDRNTRAHLYYAKEGRDFMRKVLQEWYS